MHGWWHGPRADMHKIHVKAIHAALNLPEDEGVINTNNIRSGMDWKGLAAVVAGMLGMAGLGAYGLSQMGSDTPAAQTAPSVTTNIGSPTTAPHPVAAPTATESTEKTTRIEDYEIRFFDAATGQWVEVPHISRMPYPAQLPTDIQNPSPRPMP